MTGWPGGVFEVMSWPFPVRPSLGPLADPEIRAILALALAQCGVAVLLLSIAAIARRGRVVAGLVAGVLLVLRLPALGLLFVPAYPASYRVSPTGFSAAAIAEGRAVYVEACAACHGLAGDGVGGKGQAADLRRGHIWSHTPGDLFWFLSNGIAGPDGQPVMPGFASTLSEHARWTAIDYVQALNAGGAVRGAEGWRARLLAPDAPLRCAAPIGEAMRDLRGKAVRLILGGISGPAARLAPVDGVQVVSVWAPAGPEPAPPWVDCVMGDGAAAYGVLAGEPDGRVTDARFLIDASGVLRSIRRSDDAEVADPVRLMEELRVICAEPLTIQPGDDHDHRR